jgi:glycosyltransferase involved in cell wall biosynthesis
MYDLALEFSERGNNVTVVTLSENLNRNFEIEKKNGITILRFKTGKIEFAKSKFIRGLNEFFISYRIWKYGKKYFVNNPSDLLIWYSPTIFFGKIISKLKKLNNSRTYLILRDIFPQWAIDTGNLKKGFFYYFLKKMEIFQYNQADKIGVQSPSNLEYFRQNKFKKSYRLEVLYNWTKVQSRKVPCSNFRKNLNIEDKIIFFYGGNIGIAQDIDNILRLATNLKDCKEAYFLIFGDGSEFNRIDSLIKLKNLKNISLNHSLSQEKYLSILSEVDVGIISLDKNFKTSNFPGKMLGYMEFSLPMLISLNKGNDLKDLIEKSNSGYVSYNGDDESLKTNALEFIKNPNLINRLGVNSRALLEQKFTSKKAVDKILSP